MSILEVRNLSVQYHTGQESRQALDGISFSVGEGETVGIVGESGSGKSTAMLAVMGLLGDSAEVSADGITVCANPVQPGRDIAMILQDSLNCLNPAVKIGRQITETVRIHRKCTRREAKERAEELLDMAGIRSPKLRMGQYPFELSGGMRQRVMIAMALACSPKLLLADEPTTALDITIQGQILRLLGKLARERDMGVLLITHDLGVVAEAADDVAVMYAGQLMEQAPVSAFFERPLHPYSEGLMACAPLVGNHDRTRLPSIPGMVPLPSELPEGCSFSPRCPHASEACRKAPPLRAVDEHRLVRCWKAFS